jgi:transcriptional regulator with XRE-family HTH domain
VKGTGINEGYLSQLISGEKKNPSGLILAQIADFLGIPMNYFYRPPPSQEAIDQVSDIDPAVLRRLSGKTDN